MGSAEERVRERLKFILQRYPNKEAAILPLLRAIEEEFGTVDPDRIKLAARLLEMSPARVYGIFTFYTHFRPAGSGRYVLQVCSTLPCALRNSEAIFDHISRKLGIGDGQTTSNGVFTLKKVECLGACDKAPFVQINDQDYPRMTPEIMEKIIEELSGKADEPL
jgi:NADH dehydrogenase (ubiquinone) flavoprotein 2